MRSLRVLALSVLVAFALTAAPHAQSSLQQMTLQAPQIAAIVNGTITRQITSGLDRSTTASILVSITGGGAATGTLQLFLEDSVDGGVTWDDVVSSNTFAFGAATITQRFFLAGLIATTATQGSAAAIETLAAGTVRSGPFGYQFRVREKVSGVAGSPAGPTYSITATFKL